MNEKLTSVLREAVEALYFDDSSDYKSALYAIVSILTDNKDVDERDIYNLFKQLNKDTSNGLPETK